MIPILFERNNHYLIAVYELASIGLINPAYLNLRAAFEGTTQIYLLHLTKREAELFYKDQLEMLTSAEREELNDKYRWLGPARVRKILYSGTKKEQINAFYSAISNSAHPSIKSAMMDFELSEDAIIDVLDLTLMITISNLIAINESCFEIIKEKEREEVSKAIDKVVIELNGELADLIPNNPNIKDKLNIKYT